MLPKTPPWPVLGSRHLSPEGGSPKGAQVSPTLRKRFLEHPRHRDNAGDTGGRPGPVLVCDTPQRPPPPPGF